jgi:hypothetical protein
LSRDSHGRASGVPGLTTLGEYEAATALVAEIAQDAWWCAQTAGAPRRYEKRGRPSGPKDPAFNFFVDGLLTGVENSGGHLTFTKADGGKGTLLDALRNLASQLPPGFIPKVLPLSRLDRIVLKWRRERKLKARKTDLDRANPASARRYIERAIAIGVAASSVRPRHGLPSASI